MSDETKYSPNGKSLFGIRNCIVYSVVSKDLVDKKNRYKDEISHFDVPIFVTPVNKRKYLSKIYLLSCVLTFGIFSVFCHWFPNVFRIMNYCASTVDESEYFIVTSRDSFYTVVERRKFKSLKSSNYEVNLLSIFGFISPESLNSTDGIEIIFFMYCGSIYKFDPIGNEFALTKPSLDNTSYADIRSNISTLLGKSKEPTSASGGSDKNNTRDNDDIYPLLRSNLQNLFGECSCEVKILPILDLIQNEIFHPFFIFQITAIIVWFNSSYVEYAVCIIVITFFTLLNSVLETRSSHVRMNEMSKLNFKISIISVDSSSSGLTEKIVDSSELIPGDLILLEPGMTLPCDAVLLSSDAILNEAALTGESIPVIKTPIPKYSNGVFSFENDQKHMVFSRTVVIGINGNRYGVALVLRTGFSTLQGLLYQSMYSDIISNRIHFQNDRLYKDSMRFVKFCFFVGILGCFLTAFLSYMVSVDLITIFFKSLDLFTIVAPPALPATIAASCNIAIMKLKKKKIACSNPSCVNISGQVNTVVFDKTGTLTTDGLDVIGCISFTDNKTNRAGDNSSNLIKNSKDIPEILSKALATCHSITYIDRDNTTRIGSTYSNFLNSECNENDSGSRIPVGEPLEMCMLHFSGWKLQDKNKHYYDYNRSSCRDQSLNAGICSSIDSGGNNNNNNDCDYYLNSIINSKTKFNFNEISSTRIVRRYLDCNQNNSNSNINVTNNFEELEIIKVFEFCSKLRRMTVLCRNPKKPTEIMIFCKGSPEQIKNICNQNTIPNDFDDHILSYSRIGMRIIGFAFGYFDIPQNISSCFLEELTRSQIEDKLNYIGLMIFANKLRPNSISVISTLKNANINCIISTGDHTNTAISVANECGIISNTKLNNESRIYVAGDVFTDNNPNTNVNKTIKWTLLSTEFEKINEFSSIQEVLLNYNFENINWVVTGQCLRSLYELHNRFGLEFLDLSNTPVEDSNIVENKSKGNYFLKIIKNVYNYICSYFDSSGVDGITDYTCSNWNRNYIKNGSTSRSRVGSGGASSVSVNSRTTNDLPKWIPLESISRENSYYCGLKSVLTNNCGFARGIKENEEYIGFNNVPYNLNCTRNQINLMKENSVKDFSEGDLFDCYTDSDLAPFEKKMILRFDAKFNEVPFSIKMSALEFIIRYCHVYCRMTPTDKALHVTNLQKLNPKTYVCMCGDGNNDILAIQSADIGVSIADHDASIPPAFVSSVDRNIDAVPDILLEGRAALTSTIQSFQYIVMYIFIQFTAVLFLYSIGTNFTDHQFIWTDLIAFLPISIFATFTRTNKKLPPKFPIYTNILSNNVLVGVFIQCFVQLLFLVINNYVISKQEGFTPYVFNGVSIGGERIPEHQICIENTTIFLTACIQLFSTGIALHRTKPFRLSLTTNMMFTVHALLLLAATIYMLFDQNSQISNLLNIVYLPGKTNYVLLLTFTINFLVSFIVMKVLTRKLYYREVRENGPTFFPQLYPLVIPNKRIEWKVKHY